MGNVLSCQIFRFNASLHPLYFRCAAQVTRDTWQLIVAALSRTQHLYLWGCEPVCRCRPMVSTALATVTSWWPMETRLKMRGTKPSGCRGCQGELRWWCKCKKIQSCHHLQFYIEVSIEIWWCFTNICQMPHPNTNAKQNVYKAAMHDNDKWFQALKAIFIIQLKCGKHYIIMCGMEIISIKTLNVSKLI